MGRQSPVRGRHRTERGWVLPLPTFGWFRGSGGFLGTLIVSCSLRQMLEYLGVCRKLHGAYSTYILHTHIAPTVVATKVCLNPDYSRGNYR